MRIREDLACLIDILPKSIQGTIRQHSNKDFLIEIVMDLGRRPEARFSTHPEYLSTNVITWQDLDYSIKRLSKFADDNRAGIERTLHRISCIRNRQGQIVGLTCRVGRALCGTINIIQDLLESSKSLLILGRPGVGKTTMVRELARVISNEMGKRVVIIDTSNEIAGNSDIPHIGIGRARRMQVSHTDLQHKVMIEAVENHMPEIIIIDEIGTELEALAAQTIAERGVQLIGTAHGNNLGNLLKNPILSGLVGGIQYVTLSDEEARRRGTQKSILERKGPASFQLVIELNERFLWTIHEKVENSVDILLKGQEPKLQVRKLDENGNFKIFLQKPEKGNSVFNNKSSKLKKNWRKIKKSKPVSFNSDKMLNNRVVCLSKNDSSSSLIIFDYSISRSLVKQCASLLKLNIEFTDDLKKAKFILGLKNHIRDNLFLLNTAKQANIPIYTIQNNSQIQITQILSIITN